MTTVQKVIKYCAMAFAIFLCVSIIGGIIGALAGIDRLFDSEADDDDATSGNVEVYKVSDNIEKLDIDIGAVRLEIKNGSSFEVEFDSRDVKVEEKKGTLTIKEKGNVYKLNKDRYKVSVTIPEGYTFEKVDIESGAGTVDIDSLAAEKLSLDLGAGTVNIDELISKTKTEINTGAGALTIKGGALADLDLDMGVGKADIKSCITGNSEIDHGMGKLDLTLIGEEDDYRILCDKGVGSFEIDGHKIKDNERYGNGKNVIDIDGGVGSINVEFDD